MFPSVSFQTFFILCPNIWFYFCILIIFYFYSATVKIHYQTLSKECGWFSWKCIWKVIDNQCEVRICSIKNLYNGYFESQFWNGTQLCWYYWRCWCDIWCWGKIFFSWDIWNSSALWQFSQVAGSSRVKQGQTLTLTSRAGCFYDFELFCWYHVLHLPFLWVPSFPHIYLLMAKWIITYVFLLTSPFHYGWHHFEQFSMEYWKKSRIALFQLYCTLWLFPKNLCHSLDQLYAKLKPIRFISHIFLHL